MADAAIVHYSGDWVFYNGNIAEGALLEVFDAGTSNHANIFLDPELTTPAPNPVVANASGLLPFVWIGAQSYKVILTTSGGTMIDEQDNIQGALDLSPFQGGTFAKPDTDITVRTSNYTMQEADIGTVINVDPTGGSFTVTLLSAVTVGNGRGVKIHHIGSSNAVAVASTLSQTISYLSNLRTRIVVPAFGASVELVSDGSNWHVVDDGVGLGAPFGPGVIRITDRVVSAPGSPAIGALYIVATAFSPFAQHQIIEATGSGFNAYTPPTDCGWLAYVQDEDALYQFRGSAWVSLQSSDTASGFIQIASQSDLEGATNTTQAVTPGRQHFHPGHPKFWGIATVSGGSPSLQLGFNVSSVNDGGPGDIVVSFINSFTSANYAALVMVEESGATNVIPTIESGSRSTGSISFLCYTRSAGTLSDPNSWHFTGLGDR